MAISKKENDKAIKELKKGIDVTFDAFIYGADGVRAGDIYTYGKLVGMREVLEERMALSRSFSEEDEPNA